MADVVLKDLLAAELLLVQQLSSLLQQEQDALIGRQFDLVGQLIAGKTTFLQSLESASKARAAYCTAKNLQTSEQIAAALGDDSAIWFNLLQNAKLAEMMNRTNGQLIQTHDEVNRHVMASLAAQRNPDVGYSADGRLSQLSAISRPFDRA